MSFQNPPMSLGAIQTCVFSAALGSHLDSAYTSTNYINKIIKAIGLIIIDIAFPNRMRKTHDQGIINDTLLPTPKKQVLLITYPRTASNLLVKMLSLE
jgi:hypothetical protein